MRDEREGDAMANADDHRRSDQGKAGVVLDLTGKAALVTGSGAGIGRAIALLLARAGASIAVNDADGARAESTRVAIVEAGGRAVGAVGDVTDESDVRA